MKMEGYTLNESQTKTVSTSPRITSPVMLTPFRKEFFLTLRLLAPIWPIIILFGLLSNIINICVFLKTGAKDNVTTLLLSLALSDLAFLTLISSTVAGYIIIYLDGSKTVRFGSDILFGLLYWPASTAYDLSALISVSLGVMRCACVAMPLKFKLVFTRSRTIKWVMFLAVLTVSLRLPVLTIHRISWRTDAQTNESVPYLKEVNSAYMLRINDILNRITVVYILYITMITCVIILSLKLYQASKMRRSFTAGLAKAPDGAPDKPVTQGLSSKDMQVVKSVVLVCTIFILSQLPFLLLSTIRLISPNFDIGQKLQYISGIFNNISLTCSFLNASVNIFVYYKYNSKYKSIFRGLFSWERKK